MRVLVVGGAGYVGAVLTRELLERGYAVRVLDRLFFGDAGLREVEDRVELVVGDMRRADREVLEGIDAVVNVGGLSNDPTAEYNPRANFEMNTAAAERLALSCRERGIRRYLYASSASVYDRGVGREASDVVQDETTPVAPRAAYAVSKYRAERALLELAGADFCPVILRKGTVYGYSPRMRFDLVVNSFVREALARDRMQVLFGGEMWRPMVEVRDAARAYVACLEADEATVRGQVLNVVHSNLRISELALRTREALRRCGVDPRIEVDYGYRGVRSYRVSGEKIERLLGVRPVVDVEASVGDMVRRLEAEGVTEYDHPRYSNLAWMKLLEQAQEIISHAGGVFELPPPAARPIPFAETAPVLDGRPA